MNKKQQIEEILKKEQEKQIVPLPSDWRKQPLFSIPFYRRSYNEIGADIELEKWKNR